MLFKELGADALFNVAADKNKKAPLMKISDTQAIDIRKQALVEMTEGDMIVFPATAQDVSISLALPMVETFCQQLKVRLLKPFVEPLKVESQHISMKTSGKRVRDENEI